MMEHFTQLLWAAGGAAFVAGAAWGAGGFFQKWLSGCGGLLPSERAALRFLGGAGALGLLVFLVGLLHFSRWSSVVILSGAVLLNFRFPFPDWRRPSLSPCLCFALAVVLLLFLGGLARPVGDIDADEISYHLLGPPIWLREGRITLVMEESLTAFPATIEVLYGLARTVANESAPGALGVLFFGGLLLQVRGLARRLGAGRLGGDLAAAFLAGMPAVTSTADNCFVDLPYAAFILAAARLAFEEPHRGRVIVAGVFAGLACGTKYFGLPSTLLVAGLVLVFQTGKAAPRLREAMALLIVAGLTGGVWYVRNWLLLGSPIYPPPPSVWHWFPTPNFSLEASIELTERLVKRGAGFGRGFLDLLLLPFRLTYWTAWFHGGGGIGLTPLAFGPVALALVWKKREPLAWTVLAALLTIFWFYSDQEFRFLDPAVAIYAALAGVGAEALWQRGGKATRSLALATIALSLGLGGARTFTMRADRLRAVFSPAHAEARYRNGVPHLAAFDFLNSRPEVQKVFLCHPYTTAYYLQKPYTVAFGRLRERPHAALHTVADAIPALRDLGVTHVLDVNFYDSGFAWPVRGAGRLVYEEKGARIYAREDAAPP